MSDHKWGIFWMTFYGWNAAGFAWDATTGRTGLAIAALFAAIVCAYLAIDRLSRRPKPHPYDLAMKHAIDAARVAYPKKGDE